MESSCDESALALFSRNAGVVGEWVHSQLELHCEYGGVVPVLASREHLRAFSSLLEVMQAKLAVHGDVDTIAVTNGPGLAGCLALGIGVAKSLSLAWGVPIVGVNHLRGHAFSPFIEKHREDPEGFSQNFNEILPHLGLLVSGGNTLLFEINEEKRISILGQTVDDAAGEALDKGAKLLGMPYPGGALIEKTAIGGDASKYYFPRAFADKSQLNFSFSGLKTSLRYRLEKMSDTELEDVMPDICASYQKAVVDSLINKVKIALISGQYNSFGLSGGVANNKSLKEACTDIVTAISVPVYIAKT